MRCLAICQTAMVMRHKLSHQCQIKIATQIEKISAALVLRASRVLRIISRLICINSFYIWKYSHISRPEVLLIRRFLSASMRAAKTSGGRGGYLSCQYQLVVWSRSLIAINLQAPCCSIYKNYHISRPEVLLVRSLLNGQLRAVKTSGGRAACAARNSR